MSKHCWSCRHPWLPCSALQRIPTWPVVAVAIATANSPPAGRLKPAGRCRRRRHAIPCALLRLHSPLMDSLSLARYVNPSSLFCTGMLAAAVGWPGPTPARAASGQSIPTLGCAGWGEGGRDGTRGGAWHPARRHMGQDCQRTGQANLEQMGRWAIPLLQGASNRKGGVRQRGRLLRDTPSKRQALGQRQQVGG